MRNIFLVAAKLIGIIQLLLAFGNSMQMTVFVLNVKNTTPYVAIIMGFAPLAVSIILAWTLLFKTERLADWLNISRDLEKPLLENVSMLYIGTKLIGLYIMIGGVTQFSKSLCDLLRVKQDSIYSAVFQHSWLAIIPGLVQITLGLLLLLWTNKIVVWIGCNRKTHE